MYGIIKLLTPPFENGMLEPGYIKAYLPGVRENGGQYTHGAIWGIIAMAILGMNDKAMNFLNMINPISHSDSYDKALKYKVEPYVIVADIYGAQDMLGRGGWTWYTGSSGWFYKAGIEYILGLKIENGILSFSPCVPHTLNEYSIRYEFGSSVYNITIKNFANGNSVNKFFVNGEEILDKRVKLIDNGRIYEVIVEI